MLVMVVSDAPERERKELLALARDEAALHTEEHWLWLECGTAEELAGISQEREQVDFFCLDLTIPGVLELAPSLRARNPESYIIIVADARISPVRYLRPQIGAGSLLLKPLRRSLVSEIFGEAMRSHLGLEREDDSRMYVVETKGEKILVAFSRINYFEAREKKIFLCTDSEEYGFYGTMDELEKRLAGEFLRVHRGFLVRKKKIEAVFLAQNRLVLVDGSELPISRSCKGTVKQYLQEAGE